MDSERFWAAFGYTILVVFLLVLLAHIVVLAYLATTYLYSIGYLLHAGIFVSVFLGIWAYIYFVVLHEPNLHKDQDDYQDLS